MSWFGVLWTGRDAAAARPSFTLVRVIHDVSPHARDFASDNYAGAHPEVLHAIADANRGHVRAYGDDPVTDQLQTVIRRHFGEQSIAYPVFTGTAANVLALQTLLPRWGAVVTTTQAHIDNDEGGAPEHVAGVKLLPVATADGKLTPSDLDRPLADRGDQHRAQPVVLSLTESTELGTAYSPDELAALCAHAHRHGMKVHVDGARLANAATHFDVPLRALTTDVGVDVVSLGGTKNGALGAEAVVVLDPEAVDGVDYLRKASAQLASKM